MGFHKQKQFRTEKKKAPKDQINQAGNLQKQQLNERRMNMKLQLNSKRQQDFLFKGELRQLVQTNHQEEKHLQNHYQQIMDKTSLDNLIAKIQLQKLKQQKEEDQRMLKEKQLLEEQQVLKEKQLQEEEELLIQKEKQRREEEQKLLEEQRLRQQEILEEQQKRLREQQLLEEQYRLKEKQQQEEEFKKLREKQQQEEYQKQKKLLEITNNLFNQIIFPTNNPHSSNISETLTPENKLLINNHLKTLNPHKANVEDSEIKFFVKFSAVSSKIEKTEEEIKQMQKTSQQTLLQIYTNVNNSSNIQNCSNELVMAGLYSMYNQAGHKIQITNQNHPNNNSISDVYQSQMLLTGQTQNIKFLSLKIQDSQELSFDQIQTNSDLKNDFINRFLNAASQQRGVPIESIQILSLEKGSISVKYRIQNLDQIELENLVKKGTETFKKYFHEVALDIKSFVENFQIRPDMFSPSYNMYWGEQFTNQKEYRGGFNFVSKGFTPQQYLFPVGYFGYGLNVDKWLKEDKQWLAMDQSPTTWVVLFHGTKANYVNAITYDNLKAGPANGYGGSKCRITGQTIAAGPNANVYFSDNIRICEGYTDQVQIGNKHFRFVFQCRVNPAVVTSGAENYYTVEDKYSQENVRPYRILVKQN